jgi:hypothetical protein
MSRVRRRGALKREGEWLAWWWRVTPRRKKKSTQLSCSPRKTTGKKRYPLDGDGGLKEPRGEAGFRKKDGLQARMDQNWREEVILKYQNNII